MKVFAWKLRALALVAAAVLLAGGVAEGWAQQTWDVGEEPGTVTATLSASGKVLTISGTGNMKNYSGGIGVHDDRPWAKSLTTVVIEEGVTSIGYEAFSSYGSLTSVTIPNSVTYIGLGAFASCYDLTSVNIPNGVTYIGDGAFGGCTSLTSVNIPSSVTYIGEQAFVGCKMTSITIPNGVTEINASTFSGCDNLVSVSIPNSVASIGKGAFNYCSRLPSIIIPNSVTEINAEAFRYCTDLVSVFIPNSVDTIGKDAFKGCSNLTSIIIGEGVTSLNGFTFKEYPKLATLVIGNSVKTSIEKGAFKDRTSLKSVTIGNSVPFIGDETFYGCTGLSSVIISDGVEEIGDRAFYGCTGLKTATIGSGVGYILDSAFAKCSGLSAIISLRATPPTTSIGAFSGVNKSAACLYVPEGGISAYKSATEWKDFSCVNDVDNYVSVASRARVIPQSAASEGSAIAPVPALSAEFAAGPNPASRSSGSVSFYRVGGRVSYATLSVYDASGNVVRKIRVIDDAVGSQSRRKVGSWDLRDAVGRPVSEGTYLVKGAVKASGGKRERVSVVVGVVR